MVAADIYVGGHLALSLSGEGDADKLLAEARAITEQMSSDKRVCFELRHGEAEPDRVGERTRIAERILSFKVKTAGRRKMDSKCRAERDARVESYLAGYKMSGGGRQ